MKPAQITLKKIFNLQEKLMRRAMRHHKAEWEFIRDCIDLVLDRRFIKEKITDSDMRKLQVVHKFLNDAFSTIINSLKMCLYGCLTDSLSLLRSALEELAIMNYIVQEGLFKTAEYELSKKLKRLEFDEITKSIKHGSHIKKLHGKLSELASHGTSERIRSNKVFLQGQYLPTVTMAIDDKRTRKDLYEIMDVSLYMIRILTDFYSTKKEVISDYFFSKGVELETRYKAIRLDKHKGH